MSGLPTIRGRPAPAKRRARGPEPAAGLPASATPTASRIPVVTIRPNNYRPPREEDRPSPAEQAALQASFLHTRFSFFVAYTIQDRCGRVPLTAYEKRTLEHRRDLSDREDPGPLVDGLHAAADRLIDELACSHCMARGECPGRGHR